jgi:MFS family permease
MERVAGGRKILDFKQMAALVTGVPPGNAVDARAAIVSAAWLIALSQILINVQPLTMGAIADAYHMTDRQLGYLSAAFVGFGTLCTVSGPLWVRRTNWRIVTAGAVLLSSAILLAGSLVDSYQAFLALFATLGLVKSLVGIPSFASLGDTANPDRSYGISVAMQGVVAAAASAALASWILPKAGMHGLFYFLAAAILSGLVACLWLPTRGPVRSPGELSGPQPPIEWSRAGPVLVSLLALALFIGGILGFWYFVERIGTARGASVETVGLALSLSAFATISTAGLVAWLGGRFASMTFVLWGTLLVLSGYALLIVPGDLAYTLAVLLFALGWGLAQPAYWAISRRVDRSSRLFVAGPATGGAAGVLIGLTAGSVIETGGYGLLMGLSAGLMVGAAGLGFVAEILHRQLNRRDGLPSPAAG